MASGALSSCFDRPGANFVLLPVGIKFPPIEKDWQKHGHSYEEAAAHEGNVGVVAGNGYIGLDEDDLPAFEGLELPATTSWETRPGRIGLWLKCSDNIAEALAKIGKKADQAQLKLFKNGKPIGEVKLERTYQVVPPSWKEIGGQRVDYKMLEEVPPAEISLAKLLNDLQALGIAFSSKPKSNTAKPEEIVKKSGQRRAETDEQRTRRYAEAALRDEVQTLASTPEGNRNEQLNRSAFALGQFVSAGVLSEAEVVRELSKAASYAGLGPDEIERTIRSGLESGARHPRKIPERSGKEPSKTEATEAEGTLPEIQAKALAILEHGDPIQFITDSCGRMVLGAEKAFKKLICCVAVQGIRQSAGLHPKLNGESGSGKTWVVLTFAHHLPADAVVKGSSSNLAAFYHQDGDQVFRILDDYQAGNETLDTIIKQTSSVFHQPYDHRTVKKQEPITLQIGSEQTWAITSVDGCQDIQVLNRQIPINVDDSEDLTKKVNARTIARYGKGEEQFPEDEAVLICREIWRLLRSGPINVRVPFFERIEWLDTSNRRNPSIFMDLLIAHTAMNRYQRKQDSEGFYLATEEDFNCAKALFTDRDAEELVKRLTSRERDVIELLIVNSQGLTRDEIAESLKVAPDRVSQIINGRKGYGGLRQKVHVAETKISDTIRLDDDQKRTVHKTVYSLKDYDRLAGFDGVVKLKPISSKPAKQAKHELSIELSIQTAKHNDGLCKISIEEEEREDAKLKASDGQNFSSSLKIEKNAKFAKPKALDSGTSCIADGKPGLGAKHCAVCGADLTGKSQVERNGLHYCAQPGCGYQERRKLEA